MIIDAMLMYRETYVDLLAFGVVRSSGSLQIQSNRTLESYPYTRIFSYQSVV